MLIVAGSRGKAGAALLAARACLRAGAGLVTIGVPESLINPLQSRVTEEMTLPLPDRGDGTLSSRAADHILRFLTEKADVICIGPGIGVTPDTIKLLSDILASSKKPLVIDADGLNSIPYPGLMMKASAPVIITPHIGEMARLLQQSPVISHQSGTNLGLRTLNSGLRSNRIGLILLFRFKKQRSACRLKGLRQ